MGYWNEELRLLLPTQALLLCDRLRLRVLEDADDNVDADENDGKALATAELRMSHLLVESGIEEAEEEETVEEREEQLDSVKLRLDGVSKAGLVGEAAVAAAFGPAYVNLFRDHRRKCECAK